MYDFAVIGGGIVGLATANELLRRHRGADLVLLEKEPGFARHQSGHNSGVIHAGIYYQPGSLKARLGVAGNASMTAFCREHGIKHEICGKVIVAVDTAELGRLRALHERGTANGLALRQLDAEGVRALEPHVRCVAGVHVPTTGIVDYVAVALKLAELARDAGADLRLGTTVSGIEAHDGSVTIHTGDTAVRARVAVNCAGLHSDRLARASGADPGAQIVPFRGEYYALSDDAAALVRNLIYPVPNPAFPFLGVHLTRAIDGTVHAGPNAVLATSREGCRKTDFVWRDLRETLGYGGFWRLAARYPGEGGAEIYRSLVKRAFVRSLQRLVPEIESRHVSRHGSGVRAQALLPDGRLAEDFLIVHNGNAVHVCNAPSPGATASLEIGSYIADRVAAMGRTAR